MTDLKMSIHSYTRNVMTIIWNINLWETIPYSEWGTTTEQFEILWFQMIYLNIISLLWEKRLELPIFLKEKGEKGRERFNLLKILNF